MTTYRFLENENESLQMLRGNTVHKNTKRRQKKKELPVYVLKVH